MAKGRKGLDNGVLGKPSGTDPSNCQNSRQNICFSSLVKDGENSNGFTAITPNGISRDERHGRNNQINFGKNADGERWSGQGEWDGNRSGD